MDGKFSIKRGSVTVWVYPTPRESREGWTLVYFEPDGTRKRIFRGTREDITREAETQATRLANLQNVLVGTEAAEACAARAMAEKAGMTLVQAVQYALDRINEKNALERINQTPLPQLKDEFLTSLEQDGASDRHVGTLRARLVLFTKDFTTPPATITAPLIEDWLRTGQKRHDWSGRTRNHYRAAISNLLAYAKRRGCLPRGWNEMELVPKAVEEDEEIGVYSPDNLADILSVKMDRDLLPYVVISAFAGTRPSEVTRLRWEDFHWDTGELFVGKGKVRTAGHRIAPLLPACVAWLKRIRKTTGPVTRITDFSHPLQDVLSAANVDPVHDGLRHSFISYRRALTKNLGLVSGETGTSQAVLTKRYCRPVKQADAERWFNTLP